jgi:hypothetical protein
MVNKKNTKAVKLTGLIIITEVVSAKIFPKCYLNVNINTVNVNIMLSLWSPDSILLWLSLDFQLLTTTKQRDWEAGNSQTSNS